MIAALESLFLTELIEGYDIFVVNQATIVINIHSSLADLNV